MHEEALRRIRELRRETVTGAIWNEALHPRARDGRWIEKGGWVRGLFDFFDGEVELGNGKVTGFRKGNRGEVVVDVITKDGPASAPASRITQSVQPKAQIRMADLISIPWLKDGVRQTDDISRSFEKLAEPRSKQLERFNAAAAGLDPNDPAQRAQILGRIMGNLRGTPLSTAYQYNKRGKSRDEWELERLNQHEALWEEFLARVEQSGVARDREAVVLGGLPGSGKSSSIAPGGIAGDIGITGWDTVGEVPDGATHIVLNPDVIKELMIEARMLPDDLHPNIKPREAVSLIHAESNFLVSLFFQRLAELGYNVVYDTTMANTPHVEKNIAPLAENDYRFKGVFFDIPYEESRISASRRYAQEFQDPLGGRFVPPEAGSAGSSRGYNSYNVDVFENMLDWFEDGWWFYDNTGISRGTPRGELSESGVGDGTPLARFRRRRPVARTAAGDDNLLSSSELLRMIQRGAVDEALRILQSNGAYVDAEDELPDGADWIDEASYATVKSHLQHELARAGAGDRWPEFDEEVARLRLEGLTAAVRWDPHLHPRGRDGKFIEKFGLVDIFGLHGFQHGQRGKKQVQGKVVDILPGKTPGEPIIRVEMTDPRWDPEAFGPTVDVSTKQVAQRLPTKGKISIPEPGKPKLDSPPAPIGDTGVPSARTPLPNMHPAPDSPGFEPLVTPPDWLEMTPQDRTEWLNKTMGDDFTEWRGQPTVFDFKKFDSGIALNLANTYRDLANWDPDTARRIDAGVISNISDHEVGSLGPNAIAVAHPGTAHPGGIGKKTGPAQIVFGVNYMKSLAFWKKEQSASSGKGIPWSMSAHYADPTLTLVHEFSHQRQFRFLDIAMRDVGKAWSPVVREDGFGLVPDSSNWPVTQKIRYDIPKATPTKYGQSKSSEAFAEAWTARLVGDSSPELDALLDEWDSYMILALLVPEERHDESQPFESLTPEEQDAFWASVGPTLELPGMRDHYPDTAAAYDEWAKSQTTEGVVV